MSPWPRQTLPAPATWATWSEPLPKAIGVRPSLGLLLRPGRNSRSLQRSRPARGGMQNRPLLLLSPKDLTRGTGGRGEFKACLLKKNLTLQMQEFGCPWHGYERSGRTIEMGVPEMVQEDPYNPINLSSPQHLLLALKDPSALNAIVPVYNFSLLGLRTLNKPPPHVLKSPGQRPLPNL